MILASFAEILSIGAVLPFLAVLTSPGRVFELPKAQFLIQTLGVTSAEQLLLPLTIAFGLAAIIAGAMRLLLLWANMSLSSAVEADLSININHRTIRVWAALLNAVPNSRLVMDSLNFKDPAMQEHMVTSFAEYGITREDWNSAITPRRGTCCAASTSAWTASRTTPAPLCLNHCTWAYRILHWRVGPQ